MSRSGTQSAELSTSSHDSKTTSSSAFGVRFGLVHLVLLRKPRCDYFDFLLCHEILLWLGWLLYQISPRHGMWLGKTATASADPPSLQVTQKKYGAKATQKIWRGFGGQGRDRTGDTRIFSPLLYQLSYLATVIGLNGRSAGIRTLDPVIKSHLLYQLSYAPIHRFTGARNGIRTRDNHLGKVALYQLSYPRIVKTVCSISYMT